MNPWINIWFKTEKTIDSLKNSNWVASFGLIPFMLFGVNSIGVKLIVLLDVQLEGPNVFGIMMTIVLGSILGIISSLIWVYILFFIGKMWKGQATKENIMTISSLSLMPQIFLFINLTASVIANHNNIYVAAINDILTWICLILSFRIMIIGLSRVQHFSFGFAILNIFIPQLVIGVLYLAFH